MKLRITTDPPSRMHSLQPEALRLQVSTISITAMIRTLRHWNVAVSWALKVSVDSDPAWSIALTTSLSWDWGRKIDTKSSAVSKHILAEQSQSPSHPSRFLNVPYVFSILFSCFLMCLCVLWKFLQYPFLSVVYQFSHVFSSVHPRMPPPPKPWPTTESWQPTAPEGNRPTWVTICNHD
jgi:hypothetical protein